MKKSRCKNTADFGDASDFSIKFLIFLFQTFAEIFLHKYQGLKSDGFQI